MPSRRFLPILVNLTLAWTICACSATNPVAEHEQHPHHAQESKGTHAMQTQYLEIVTPDVDATCAALEKVHGVQFGDAEADLGNARTADLFGGGLIGVRAPMHAQENTVVRPYVLVDDIESAVEGAEASGGKIALPPTEIPGRGTFAIYFLGGIEHGLWQL